MTNNDINNLINKLILKSDKSNSSTNEERFYLEDFFNPYYIKKYEIILKEFLNACFICFSENIELSSFKSLQNINLNKHEVGLIYTIFLFNSFFYSSKFNTGEITYITTDILINKFISYERKFWIYYYSSIFVDSTNLKKSLVKFYSYLIETNTIETKKVTVHNKSTVYIKINNIDILKGFTQKLNFSRKPYDLKIVASYLYLIGPSFLNITEVFRKNLYSDKGVKFLDLNYIENLSKAYVYINKEDFLEIKKIYEAEYNLNCSDLEEKIKSSLSQIVEYNNNAQFFKEDVNFEYEAALENRLNQIFNTYTGKLKLNNLALHLYVKLLCEFCNKKELDNFEYLKLEDFIIEKYGRRKIAKCNSLDLKKHAIEALEKLSVVNTKKIYKKRRIKIDYKEKLTNALKLNKKKLENILKKSNEFDSMRKIVINNYKNMEKNLNLAADEQKKLSLYFILYNFILIEKLNIFNEKIYIPFFFDFRCRKYDDSICGVTNFVPSRYFMNYGYYEKPVNTSIFTSYLDFYKKEISEVKAKLNIKRNQTHINEAIFWILISLGKELITKEKSNYSLKEFIEISKKYILNDLNGNDLEQKLSLHHYKKIIISFAENNNKKILKRFIHKDATASFIQNLIRIIGPKNEKSLIYSNLLSKDTWYDTYNIALEEWKKTLEINQKYFKLNSDQNIAIDIKYLSFFNRKAIKKSVMTSSYDATYYTRWNNFKTISKNSNIFYDEKILECVFLNFFDFIETKLWNNIYLLKNPNCLKEEAEKIINNNELIVKSPVSAADLIYYTLKIKKHDFKFTFVIGDKKIKIRKTKEFYSVDNTKTNCDKMYQAIKANWVHFSDASLCVQINKKMDIMYNTIHDCFLIDPFNVGNFITNANEAFKEIDYICLAEDKSLIKKVFSIFIFI